MISSINPVVWGLGGFIAVVAGLVAYSVTAPRRGQGIAIVWGIVCFVLPPLLILWGIYMGLSTPHSPADAG